MKHQKDEVKNVVLAPLHYDSMEAIYVRETFQILEIQGTTNSFVKYVHTIAGSSYGHENFVYIFSCA